MALRIKTIIRRSICAFAIITLAMLAISYAVVLIPRRDMTVTAIDATAARIEIYFRQNHQLPPNLDALPIRQNYTNSIIDGWNRRLVYSIETHNSFTLGSLGQDGAMGGSGENTDVIRRFQIIQGSIQRVP